ncbi:MAG: M23 family metallopeptidase [Deltaproteobacteria bacterium]|nr:M23 family metallopeptidase [Deltaproteobacteria bacterium]
MRSPLPVLSLLLLAACRPGAGAAVVGPQASAASMAPYMGGHRLPFDGSWRVHRTHYDLTNDQAFAVDLVVDAPNPGRGGQNRDYPSYGQRIVADGPGVVAVAVDGVPDNVPGVVNGYHAHGNYVVVDHRNGEFSLFAHLITGTVRVRAGQPVTMGEELGLCGNSGHSTMAHLHWQVMDHPEPHRARPRPIRLIAYERNGRLSTDRLERGDVVQIAR